MLHSAAGCSVECIIHTGLLLQRNYQLIMGQFASVSLVFSFPNHQTDLSAGTGPSHKNFLSFPVTPIQLACILQTPTLLRPGSDVEWLGWGGPAQGMIMRTFPCTMVCSLPSSQCKVKRFWQTSFLQASTASFPFLWFKENMHITGIEIWKIGFVSNL